ncbi:hypothetical protein MUP46_01215 [Patescibacteria group bacterium]|nr:hypothetical protein [Patescibacteria group bacterium]
MDTFVKGLVRFVSWITAGVGYLLRLIGVEPTNENIAVVLFIVIVLLLVAVLLEWVRSPERKPTKGGHKTVVTPNPTNGMVTQIVNFPMVRRLSAPGITGHFVKKEVGEHSWLEIGEERFDLLILGQMTDEEITKTENLFSSDPETGTLKGSILFRGAKYEVLNRRSLAVDVEAGSAPNFTSVDYTLAKRGEGEEAELIVVENPYIPNKPTKLRTWNVYAAFEMGREEFDKAVGEVLNTVKA